MWFLPEVDMRCMSWCTFPHCKCQWGIECNHIHDFHHYSSLGHILNSWISCIWLSSRTTICHLYINVTFTKVQKNNEVQTINLALWSSVTLFWVTERLSLFVMWGRYPGVWQYSVYYILKELHRLKSETMKAIISDSIQVCGQTFS